MEGYIKYDDENIAFLIFKCIFKQNWNIKYTVL